MKTVLIDVIPFEFKKSSLNESTADGKLLVTGVLQRANAKNQNGRVYPRDILKREAVKYSENFVKQRRALGELDHPESSVVNLKNVSHNIVNMSWEGDDLIGTVEILQTPSGHILRDLLKAGILLGISSRGLGSVKKDMQESADIVQDDFDLIAFDFVSNPSTQGAFMYSIGSINENIDNTDTILIWKFMRPDKLVYPRHINNIRIGEIDTTMICFHNKYKNIARWKDSQCGDFFFYSDLFNKLKKLNIFSKKVNYIITKTNYNNKMCSSIT